MATAYGQGRSGLFRGAERTTPPSIPAPSVEAQSGGLESPEAAQAEKLYNWKPIPEGAVPALQAAKGTI